MSQVESSRIKRLAEDTKLSIRQAELYFLHVDQGKSLNDCADEMQVEFGTVSSSWDRIKNKIRLARETSRLKIP